MIAGLGYADVETGPQISLSVFYLVPVTLATWFIDRRWGVSAATICGCIWAYDSASLLSADAPILIAAWSAAFKTTFFVLVMWLVAGLKEALERSRTMANTDEMTGVLNRRAFVNAANMEIARSRRYASPISVMYMDCDHLKKINDNLGHSVGDLALQTVARTLRESTREVDSVARLGGDEFIIMLPSADQAAAQTVVAKLRTNVAEAMKPHGWPITLSIGVVTFYQPPKNADELIQKADALQYVVKHGGKNGVMYQSIGGLVQAA
jgi:diguanylate cyclase (GGDEF)-like protein